MDQIKHILDDIHKIVYKPPYKPPDSPINSLFNQNISLHSDYLLNLDFDFDDTLDNLDNPDNIVTNENLDNPDDTIVTRNWKALQKYEDFYFNISIVKSRINSFFDKNLIPIIKQRILDLNKISFFTYHLANIKLLYLLENNLPIPSFTQSFFYNLVSLVSTNQHSTKTKELDSLKKNDIPFNRLLSSLPKDYIFPPRDKICYMVSYLCIQMVTATKNHLVLNFKQRFTKYLKLLYDKFSKELIFYIVSSIIGEEDFELIEETQDLHLKFKTPDNLQIIQDYQRLFNKPKKGPINIWGNLNIFLPFYKTMLDKFLATEHKGFTLLPLKGSFIPGFVGMDTTVLENMISIQTGKAVRKNLIETDPSNIWYDKTFVKNFETARRKFDYKVLTNGYEVNIQIKVPKNGLKLPYDINDKSLSISEKINFHLKVIENWKLKKDEKKAADELQKKLDLENGIEIPKRIPYQMEIIDGFDNYKNHIGLDPGKRSLYTTYDSNMQHLRCTGKEYNNMTGHNKDRNKINNRKTKDINALSAFSFKVNTLDQYIKNLTAVNLLVNSAWQEYEKEFYRGLKFTKYQKKKKAYEKLANRIEGIENDRKAIKEMRWKQENKRGKETIQEKMVLVGYGLGGSNGSGIKGASVPIKGFYTYLKTRKNIKVVGINECYTSQKCYNCQGQLGDYNQWQKTRVKGSEEVEMKLRSVYGFRCCKSNKCRNAVYDRDENASKNIYLILVAGSCGLGRPEYLRRAKAEKKPLRKHMKLGGECVGKEEVAIY